MLDTLASGGRLHVKFGLHFQMGSLTSHTSRARFPVSGGTREGRAVSLDSTELGVGIGMVRPPPPSIRGNAAHLRGLSYLCGA